MISKIFFLTTSFISLLNTGFAPENQYRKFMWALENNEPKKALFVLQNNPGVAEQDYTRVTTLIAKKLEEMSLSDKRKKRYEQIQMFLSQGNE